MCALALKWISTNSHPTQRRWRRIMVKHIDKKYRFSDPSENSPLKQILPPSPKKVTLQYSINNGDGKWGKTYSLDIHFLLTEEKQSLEVGFTHFTLESYFAIFNQQWRRIMVKHI